MATILNTYTGCRDVTYTECLRTVWLPLINAVNSDLTTVRVRVRVYA